MITHSLRRIIVRRKLFKKSLLLLTLLSWNCVAFSRLAPHFWRVIVITKLFKINIHLIYKLLSHFIISILDSSLLSAK